MRAPALSLALALIAAAAASCASGPTQTEPLAAPASTRPAGPPLPAGSRLEEAGSQEPSGTNGTGSTEELVGSLRPDTKTPAERVPNILKRGRLIVGVDQSNNRLSYRDALTGELQGFEIDLAHELAKDIFGDPNRVDFRFVTASERTTAVTSGRVDLVIRSMTRNPQRQEEVEFSLPYLMTQTRLLVESGSGISSITDLGGKTACAADGSTSLDWVRAKAPTATILATSTWGDCLMALQQGQADAVVTDDILLSGMQAQDPYTQIVGEALSDESYAVGIRKPEAGYDTHGLVRQVNSTIERIRRDGTWYAMYSRWLGDYVDLNPLPAPDYREEDQ